MSATLERRFGGVEDMHLLKGHSSIDDLLTALRSFEARRRGSPVVVDARDFFYSRISLAIGADVLLQILDAAGNWLYCNETAAEYLGQPRDWFPGRNLFAEIPSVPADWAEILRSVAETRETYIDRTRRGVFFSARCSRPDPHLERPRLPHHAARRPPRRRPDRAHPRAHSNPLRLILSQTKSPPSHCERAGIDSRQLETLLPAGAAGFFAAGAAAFGFQNGSALIHSSGG